MVTNLYKYFSLIKKFIQFVLRKANLTIWIGWIGFLSDGNLFI